jgi:hypothetical protein
MDVSVIERLAPTMARAVDFVLERAFIEYLAMILLLIIPFRQGDTVASRTVFLIATTVVLLGMKHVLLPLSKGVGARDQIADDIRKAQQIDAMRAADRQRRAK